MKNGKPEVLIIGEEHPEWLYSHLFPQRRQIIQVGSARKKVYMPSFKGLSPKGIFEAAEIPGAIIKAEIAALREFGANQLLFEFPNLRILDIACARFHRTKNLLKLREALSQACLALDRRINSWLKELCKEKGMTVLKTRGINQYMPKAIAFRIGAARIYSIGFFESRDLYIASATYDLCKQVAAKDPLYKWLLEGWPDLHAMQAERERLMVQNLKKMIADKTAIICGASHVPAIAAGLKNKSYIHEPILIRRKG